MSQSPRRVETPALVGGVALLLALFAGGTARAQQPTAPERVTIRGRVLDEVTRVPLSGVLVYFAELDASVQTDATGQFEVKGIRMGVYQLEFSRRGYRRSTGDFAVMGEGSFVTTLIPLNAPDEVAAGRFVGRVTDGESGKPVAGVDVRIAEIFMGGVTDDAGWFDMAAVPPGRHEVEFSSLGYATRVDTVDVVSGQTSDARVRLTVDPLEVEPIEVIVERRELELENVGFYQRRDQGFGRFIDLETIQRRRPSEMTDLFTGISGATLVPDPSNPLAQAVVLRGGRLGRGLLSGGAEDCYPLVVLDGLIVHRGGDFPAQIDRLIDPTEVAGIEIFPSSVGVPVQYAGVDAACGVIVIWSRR